MNKTALVTGGSSGIGNATATLLARHGYDVVVADRVKPSHGNFEFIKLNLTSHSLIRKLLIRRYAGKVDLLVNNAGLFPSNTIVERREQWLLNVQAAAMLTQELKPKRVIYVSSVAAFGALNPYYAATKAALLGLVASDAIAGTSTPFAVLPPLVAGSNMSADVPLETKAFWHHRLGEDHAETTPEEVANLIFWITTLDHDQAGACFFMDRKPFYPHRIFSGG